MSSYRLIGAALGVAMLAACNILDPFPTVPRSLSASEKAPPGQRVGICYNTMTTSLAEVARQAQQECPADTIAEATDTDYYLQNCPLLIPGRASFLCKPTK